MRREGIKKEMTDRLFPRGQRSLLANFPQVDLGDDGGGAAVFLGSKASLQVLQLHLHLVGIRGHAATFVTARANQKRSWPRTPEKIEKLVFQIARRR